MIFYSLTDYPPPTSNALFYYPSEAQFVQVGPQEAVGLVFVPRQVAVPPENRDPEDLEACSRMLGEASPARTEPLDLRSRIKEVRDYRSRFEERCGLASKLQTLA